MIHYGIRQNKSLALRIRASGLHVGARATVLITTGVTPEGFDDSNNEALLHFCSSSIRQMSVHQRGRFLIVPDDMYRIEIDGGLPGVKDASLVRFEAQMHVCEDCVYLDPTKGSMIAVPYPAIQVSSNPWAKKGGSREAARLHGYYRANQLLKVRGKQVV